MAALRKFPPAHQSAGRAGANQQRESLRIGQSISTSRLRATANQDSPPMRPSSLPITAGFCPAAQSALPFLRGGGPAARRRSDAVGAGPGRAVRHFRCQVAAAERSGGRAGLRGAAAPAPGPWVSGGAGAGSRGGCVRGMSGPAVSLGQGPGTARGHGGSAARPEEKRGAGVTAPGLGLGLPVRVGPAVRSAP